ncbi:MAG: ABC transporter substrate-binding protein, partial [Elusimicrobiota bacterium]
MRKALNLALSLSLLGLPAACRKAEAPSDKNVVRYLTSPDIGGAGREIIARFEAKNPGIKVEMVEGPSATNTREDMYATSFIGEENTYDVIFMDVVWVPKFAAQGWLRPLDDKFPPSEQAKFLPGDIRGSKYNGNIYRVPSQSDGGMLYYRSDLLEKHGLRPPETWDELVAAAKKIQDPPRLWGFVFQGKQYEGLVCNFLEVLWGNGGEVIDGVGVVRVDELPAVEALSWLVDAVHKHKISPQGVLTYQEEEARHMFQEGRAVFMRNWPYAWNLVQSNDSPVQHKVGIKPMVHGVGEASAATLGGWGYGISTLSDKPEAAWKFVKFATSAEAQKINFDRGGVIPTRKSLFKDPEVIKRSPHFKQLFGVLSKARPR